jgi:predicted Rossmann fold nucleotide-binding protein DprA/Smf involved in DNA uptake
MKKVQSQLKTIAKSLMSLADKIEKLNAQMAAAPAPKAAKAPAKKKAPVKKAAAKKAAAPKKAATKAPAKDAAAGKETVLDKVLEVIGKSRNGATIATLKSKTSLESRQLSNALYKLSKKGKIKAQARGVYVKA